MNSYRITSSSWSGAVADPAAEPFDRQPRPGRLGLVLGDEDRGIDPEWLKRCRRVVTIPCAGAGSLNVAVAAGILLHGFTRPAETCGRLAWLGSSHHHPRNRSGRSRLSGDRVALAGPSGGFRPMRDSLADDLHLELDGTDRSADHARRSRHW